MRRFAILMPAALLAACMTAPSHRDAAPKVVMAFDADSDGPAIAEGIADPATGRRVTADDPVRIASISKLVVAIGVMRLVEQGRLDLDQDVSATLGWPLRNPAFPAEAVTLRHLLSHTSSLRDHDDQYAIPLGGSLRTVLADPDGWDRTRGPNSGYFTYANLNFPVVASIMERATGERFDRLMNRLVLGPMAIDACFNWPGCSDLAVSRAVVLAQGGKIVRDDLRGRRPDCPVLAAPDGNCDLGRWRAGENGALFAPQGGLRISARGLARIGRMLLGGGMIDGRRILAPASVQTLMAAHWSHDGRNGVTDDGFYCRYGLGTHSLATAAPGCADDPLGDSRAWVGHAGEAYGLRSGLWIDPARRVGIVYYATGLDAAPPRGRSAFTAAEERLFARAVSLGQQRP